MASINQQTFFSCQQLSGSVLHPKPTKNKTGWTLPSVPHQNTKLSPKTVCLGSEDQWDPVNLSVSSSLLLLSLFGWRRRHSFCLNSLFGASSFNDGPNSWFLCRLISELAQNLFFLYDLSHLTDYLTEISFYVSMNQDLVYPNANPLQSGIQTFWRKNRFLFLWSCLEWKLKCMSLQRAAKSSKLLWDSNKRKKDEIVMHISVLLSPFSKILNANVQKSKYLLQNVLRCVLHLKSIYFCSYIIGGCI